jgi:hypothetical protein
MVAELSVANESMKESLHDLNEFASLESKNAILEQDLAKAKRRRGEGLSFKTLTRGELISDPFTIISRCAVVPIRGGGGACLVVESPHWTGIGKVDPRGCPAADIPVGQ